MNKILFILFFLLSFQIVNAQYPGKQNLNDSTLFTAGAIQGRGGVITGIYEDTTAANLSRIAFYEGAEIQTTDGTRWYRYNGGWVQITAGSGGGGAGQHFPDGLVFVESISLSDSTVTINPNIVWRRNDTTYTRTTSFSQDITRAAIGYYRKDIIWIDSGNVFRYTVGLEDTVSAVLPNIPYNGIQVTVIDVAGTTITISEVPPTTNNFWQLGGNIIGLGQSNIIGTANAQDFVMQAGSSTRMTIQNSTGNILINNAIKALNNNHQIGNLQILTSGNAGATGEGITITGADQTFDMQGGSAPVDMFKLRSWQGDTSWIALTSNSKNTVTIKGGFGNPNIAGLTGTVLNIVPTYRFPGGLSGLDTVIGVNYHSDDRDLTGAYHIGLQNYTGDVLLNRTSGSVGIHTIPNSKTILDVASTTKGVRFSPMTATQRLAISSPPAGLMVFDTDSACYFNYTGSAWVSLCRTGGGSGVDSITVLFPFQSLVTGDSLYMPRATVDSSGWLHKDDFADFSVKVDSCVNHGDTMICYSNGIAVATSTNTVPFASTLQQAFNNSVTAGDNPTINGHGTDNLTTDSLASVQMYSNTDDGRSFLILESNSGGSITSQNSNSSAEGYIGVSPGSAIIYSTINSGATSNRIDVSSSRTTLSKSGADSVNTKVGIGTYYPDSALHVVGGIKQANNHYTAAPTNRMLVWDSVSKGYGHQAIPSTDTSSLSNRINLKANTASPTFTGTVTIPTPFTLGATSVTSTGTQLNYLNAATGTTGTTSANIMFSASPTSTGTLTADTLKPTRIRFPFTAGATLTGSSIEFDGNSTATTNGFSWGGSTGAQFYRSAANIFYLNNTFRTTGIQIDAGGGMANQVTSTRGNFIFTSGGGLVLSTSLPDATTSLRIQNNNASSTGLITSFESSISSSAFTIDRNGRVGQYGTATAGGTTGAQTINKPTGTVNFAAGATSLVVTNSLVSTSTPILCTIQTNDATFTGCQCVPGSGSFTIFANVAATAETKVYFEVKAVN